MSAAHEGKVYIVQESDTPENRRTAELQYVSEWIGKVDSSDLSHFVIYGFFEVKPGRCWRVEQSDQKAAIDSS